MIITNLKGGLGNQMFQYAFGRSLALTNNIEFKLDRTGYDRNHYRVYGLIHFNITENFASADEIKKSKYPLGLISKLERGFKAKALRVHNIGWEPTTIKKIKDKLSKNRNIYLDGFWQSYKYFEDHQDKIAKDFTLKIPLEQAQPEIIKQLTNVNSISLSVRRTDYLWPKNLKALGICSLDYYQQAIKLIKERVSDPSFFVITDDPDWVKANIDFGSAPVSYEANEKLTDYQTIIFMAGCQHNIIANSSFSWWGAWLNQNPNKIVIAPDVWFTDGSIKIDDIVLPSWIKLPRD